MDAKARKVSQLFELMNYLASFASFAVQGFLRLNRAANGHRPAQAAPPFTGEAS